jgi:osmotically-inducible protein OsmY
MRQIMLNSSSKAYHTFALRELIPRSKRPRGASLSWNIKEEIEMKKFCSALVLSGCVMVGLSGCWAAIAGSGAEAGYVAAQEERTAGQTIEDQALTASIKTKLLANSDTPGLKIDVDTFKSAVTLGGYVKSQRQVDEAVRIARETSGVARVDSRMIVDPRA